MTRLIDADELKDWSEIIPLTDDGGIDINDFEEKLRTMPTIDAVPVIRCKDCKFATITDGVYGRNPEVKYCDIWFPNEAEYMPIAYYCASAERKEE